MKSYTIKKSAVPVDLAAGWESEMWKDANIAVVDFGFEQNSDHTPNVQLKMLFDGKNICVNSFGECFFPVESNIF